MSHSRIQEIYPDFDSEPRVPVVVIAADDVPAEEFAKVLDRDWTLDTGERPVIVLRESEAVALSARITSALWRIVQATAA
ncbi:MAG TPA: hypothetical protein VH589_02560 [Trebonia sp.]|jgi:hypothetical protein